MITEKIKKIRFKSKKSDFIQTNPIFLIFKKKSLFFSTLFVAHTIQCKKDHEKCSKNVSYPLNVYVCFNCAFLGFYSELHNLICIWIINIVKSFDVQKYVVQFLILPLFIFIFMYKILHHSSNCFPFLFLIHLNYQDW